MKACVLSLVAVALGAAVAGCVPAATDQELEAMCGKLVELRGEHDLTPLEERVTKVKETFRKRRADLDAWLARDLKGWDEELKGKLAEAEDDKAKKALEEDYAKKKEVTRQQFAPDFEKLGPDEQAALKEAEKKAADEQQAAADARARCVEEGRSEGVSQKVAQCRAAAETTDAYWNTCR